MKRLIAALALTLVLTTPVAAVHTDPTCSLSALVLGASEDYEGTPVIQINANGLHHNADYRIDWVEPLINQTQFRWSSVSGTLYQTVLNNQGSGTFTASLFYLKAHDDPFAGTFEAGCNLTV